MYTLPDECVYEGGFDLGREIDVGACDRQPCRGATETDTGACADQSMYCCAPVRSEMVRVVCGDYTKVMFVTKECGCSLCFTSNFIIRGHVFCL